MSKPFGGLTHTQTSRIHFEKRLKERYGIECTEKIVQSIITQIRTHQSVRIERISLTKMVHGVKIEGRDVIVMYSSSRQIPLSALPSTCDSLKNSIRRQDWARRNKDWRNDEEDTHKHGRNKKKSCRRTHNRYKFMEN